MHNRQAITPRRLWNSLRDYDIWPIYLLGLVVYIPMTPMTSYITLILKGVGFGTVSLLISTNSILQANSRSNSSLRTFLPSPIVSGTSSVC